MHFALFFNLLSLLFFFISSLLYILFFTCPILLVLELCMYMAPKSFPNHWSLAGLGPNSSPQKFRRSCLRLDGFRCFLAEFGHDFGLPPRSLVAVSLRFLRFGSRSWSSGGGWLQPFWCACWCFAPGEVGCWPFFGPPVSRCRKRWILSIELVFPYGFRVWCKRTLPAVCAGNVGEQWCV